MASKTLARRASIALVSACVATLAPFIVAHVANRTLAEALDRAAEMRLADAARQAADLVSRYLTERRRDTEILAGLPDIVHATRVAAQAAQRRHLVGRPIAQLEREFDSTRALDGDPQIRAFLASTRDAFDFAELSISERDGFTVLGTDRTPVFVQSDEDWWQRAFADGFDESAPQFDPSGAVAIQFAVRITDPRTRMPMGVLHAALRLTRLNDRLAASAAGATVEVVDSAQRIILSRDHARLLRRLPDSLTLDSAVYVTRDSVGGAHGGFVSIAPTHDGRWWVVARLAAAEPDVLPRPPYLVAGGSAVLVFVVVFLLTGGLDYRRRDTA